MKLGVQEDLGPGHIVLDGDQHPKGHSLSNFRPMSVVTKWLDGPRCHLVGTSPRRHCISWGPTPKVTQHPHFSADVHNGQTAGWITMPLGMQVGFGSGDIVLDVDPAPPPKKVHSSPQFSAYMCCGQTAGSIKVPLGMGVGLTPGYIVLDGDPAPQRGTVASIYGPCLL